MQKINEHVIQYCQSQMGLTQVPNVSSEGITLHFSEQCKLELFTKKSYLWFVLSFAQSQEWLESLLLSKLEEFDSPLCFFRLFISNHQQLCVATTLAEDKVSMPNLDSVFEQCHRIWQEAGNP